LTFESNNAHFRAGYCKRVALEKIMFNVRPEKIVVDLGTKYFKIGYNFEVRSSFKSLEIAADKRFGK